MKKTYIRPQISIEAFTPNNYVAACYKLACSVPKKNGTNYSNGSHWKEREYGGVWHSGSGKGTCADASANRVVTDTGLLQDSQVGEYNNEQGWITGGIDDWIDNNKNNRVDADDTIYWHTYDSNKSRRWNHVGTLLNADASHPNHS